MTTIIIAVYCVLALLTFGWCELLNQPAVFYTALAISFFYFGLSFYSYSWNRDNENFAFFLTWWTYFILTRQTLRRQFVKEHHAEPILTRGSSFDFKTGRRAHFGDFLYTLMLLVIPASLSYLTAVITKASS